MELTIVDDYEILSRAAAETVAALVAERSDASLVVPTGNTPVGMYRELAARHDRGELDLSNVRVFQLDEYLGVQPDDPRSLYRWMREAFLEPCRIPDEHVIRLRADLPDPEAQCEVYDRCVRERGGYSLAVLGLGPNGHLGFNEPPVSDDAPTRLVDLSPESIRSNAAYWGDAERVPRQALTAGMRELLAAAHVVLLVSGENKHDILRRTVDGPVGPDVPASYLQVHPWTRVIADRAAWPDE